MSQRPLLAFTFVFLAAGSASADGPADNLPDRVRPVPPPGAEVPAADRAELEAGAAEMGKAIDSCRPGRIAAAGFFGESWDLLPDIPADGQAPEDE